MKRFEIGAKYTMNFVGDHDLVITYTVIDRTEKTITIKDDHGEVKKCRINTTLSNYDGAECVFPLGRYSMAPILRAKHQV